VHRQCNIYIFFLIIIFSVNPAHKLLQKMFGLLEESKRNIYLFYQNQNATMTDLYRAKFYTDMLEKNIERLNYYLEENGKINRTDKNEYARNLNNISLQTKILKVTQEAMDDEVNKLKKLDDIQGEISGKMIFLKKELRAVLNRAEKYLKH